MALDESTENLQEIESNGVTAHIDPGLYEQLQQVGAINIDYVANQYGQSGYRISVGDGDCSTKGCKGC